MRRPLLVLLIAVLIVSGPAGCRTVPLPTDIVDGGTVVIGIREEPVNLNPVLWRSQTGVDVTGLIFSGLFRRDDRGDYQPDLALELPTVDNGGITYAGETMTVTYRLRRDVRWHDGNSFVARDVEFTYRCYADAKLNPVNHRDYLGISSLEVPNPYTVRVNFTSRTADYRKVFDRIIPAHLLDTGEDISRDAFNRRPVGTGPFHLVNWHPGDRIVLGANPEYYGGRPELDGLVFRLAPDLPTLVRQLKTGQIDLCPDSGLLPESIDPAYGITVQVLPTPRWDGLVFNLTHNLLKDSRIRQAVLLAIDRTYPVAAADPDLPRDPARARLLLAEGGWVAGADGFFSRYGVKLRITNTISTGDSRQAQLQALLREQLREAGIELVPLQLDPAAFAGILTLRNFDTVLLTYREGAEFYPRWHSAALPPAGGNYAGYRSPLVDGLLTQRQQTTDPAVRQSLEDAIWASLRVDLPVIPLGGRVSGDAVTVRLENYRPTLEDRLWNAAEWKLRD